MKATNLQLGLFTAQLQLFEYNNWITFSESIERDKTEATVKKDLALLQANERKYL